MEVEEDAATRAFNALVNPFTTAEASNDPVDLEIRRLNKAQKDDVSPPIPQKIISYTDKNGVDHKNYRLTEQQYQKMAQTELQTAHKVLDTLFNSKGYEKLTEDQKAYTINAVYEYAQEKGRQAALGDDYYSKAASWVAKTKDGDVNAFIKRGAEQKLNSVIENAVTSAKNNWTVSNAAVSDIEAAYSAVKKLDVVTKSKIMDDATGAAARYFEARERGATTTNFLEAEKQVNKLGENATDYGKYEAVAKMAVSDSAKDALVKIYMDDYNPESESPIKTELKYDYLRKEFDMSPQEAVAVMKVNGEYTKKAEKESEWRKMGYTPQEIELLWLLLGSTSKSKTDVVAWHNSQ